MALVTVKPTKPDVLIARTVARNTNHRAELVSRGLTWGVDKKTLMAMAVAGWIEPKGRSKRCARGQPRSLVTVLASLPPHA